MTSLTRSKKAEEGSGFSLIQVIGIAIAVIVVLGILLPLIVKLYNLFLNNPDQGTVHSFQELSHAIQKAESGKDKILVSFFIENGFRVVGFNKETNNVKETCWWHSNIRKPVECGVKACLALCTEKGDCRKGAKDYTTFENIETIKADPNLKMNYGDGNSFVIYGKCGLKTYGVQNIYIQRIGNDIVISS